MPSSAGHTSYFCQHVMPFYRCVTRHLSVFSTFFHASSLFRVMLHIFSIPYNLFPPVVNVHLLKIVSTPTWTYSHLSPLLVVKLTNSTLLLAVNFHPSPSPVPHTHNPPPPPHRETERQGDRETGREMGDRQKDETGRETRQAWRCQNGTAPQSWWGGNKDKASTS